MRQHKKIQKAQKIYKTDIALCIVQQLRRHNINLSMPIRINLMQCNTEATDMVPVAINGMYSIIPLGYAIH